MSWKCSFCTGYGRGVLDVRILKGLGAEVRKGASYGALRGDEIENSRLMVARKITYVNT